MGKAKGKTSLVTDVHLNNNFVDKSFIERIKTAFFNRTPINDDSLHVYSHPFMCCHISDFIQSEPFINGLLDQVCHLEFDEKNNDLYKFHQSNDLKEFKEAHINALTDKLVNEVIPHLKEVTGIPLYDAIDLTCSRYEYTDVLLCHDDELEGRRIAFILYLTPEEWNKDDGGRLCLFDTDEHGQPKDIVEKLLPTRNSFVFFEVTPKSFHQVEEIIAKDKVRFSIAGWFHGPDIARDKPYIEPPFQLQTPTVIETDMVNQWLNPTYLDVEEALKPIQSKFEEDSQIEMENFILDDKFEEISKALRMDTIVWNKKGPPNKRCILVADEETLPGILRNCKTFLQSEFMFYLLSNMTGLDLTDVEGGKCKKAKLDSSSDSRCNTKDSDPRCRIQFRKWSQGCYTLAHDMDTEGQTYALDVSLYTDCQELLERNGGFVSYIAKDEDEELLTVNPVNNSLSLVYRDTETLRFVKHVNHSIAHDFYEIYLVFYE